MHYTCTCIWHIFYFEVGFLFFGLFSVLNVNFLAITVGFFLEGVNFVGHRTQKFPILCYPISYPIFFSSCLVPYLRQCFGMFRIIHSKLKINKESVEKPYTGTCKHIITKLSITQLHILQESNLC